MNHRNLIPPQRLAAKRKQQAIRRWVLLDATALCVLGIAVTVCVFCGSGETPAARAAPVAIDVEKLNASFVRLRQDAARVSADLWSVLDVSEGPDWSVLLSVLAQSMGDDVVLNAVEYAATPAAGDALPAGRMQCRIGGMGKSQAAVTQFVLRLEGLHFFDQVQLVQTAPQSLHGADCVGFRLVCTLGDAAGSKP